MAVNKVILIGRLGANPETRFTPDGRAICKLSVATDSKYKGETITEWHRITMFGKMAEIADQYCKKGNQVYIEGNLHYSKYQKDDGSTVGTVEILANNMQLLGDKPKTDNNQTDTNRTQAQSESAEDVPF